MTILATVILGCFALAASISDVKLRKVRNGLNLTILVSGLAWRGASLDASAIALGVAGAGVGIALLFPLFYVRWVGAGDVKLLAAFGAWLGPQATVLAALFGVAGGGVLSIAIAIAGGSAVRRQVSSSIVASIITRTAPVAPKRDRHLVVPLAVPFGAAALGVFVYQGLP